MAEHFLGSLISLVSTSDIRYRGILRQIDHVNSTIQLEQVYSMGTEHRRPAHEYLPPNPKPYDYIVFRATEVKDLNVERHATDMQTAMLNNDPAIIGASSGVQPPPPPQTAATPQAQAPAAPAPATSTTPAEPAPAPGPAAATIVPAAAATEPAKANGQQQQQQQPQQPQQPRNVANVRQQQTQRQVSRDGSIRSAEVAVESVERAMDQLRVSSGDEQQPPAPQQQPSTERRGGGGGRGRGRRGGHHGPAIKGPGVVPDTPFDFNRANAKFDKASLVLPELANAGSPEAGAETPSTSEAGTPAPGSASAAGAASPNLSQFYDKKKSFFDDISSDSKARSEEASTGVRVGGAAMARQRREEERNRNLSTFGETGIAGAQHHWHGGGGRGGPGGRGRGGRRRGGGGGGRGASSSAAAVSAQ